MNITHALTLPLAGVAAIMAFAGCHTTEPRKTTGNPHPGPVVGHAVGQGVGVVAGNVAGTAVGFGAGVAHGASAPFNTPTTHVVRRWRTETTSDGRTIHVPEEILVDEHGRPFGPAPSAPRK